MLKFALILSATALTTIPARAETVVTAPVTIEHDGSRYTYTVTQKKYTRVINGMEEKSLKHFNLHVGKYMVYGTYDGTEVSFPLKSVKPMTGIVQIASR
jgi:hypothetical protein